MDMIISRYCPFKSSWFIFTCHTHFRNIWLYTVMYRYIYYVHWKKTLWKFIMTEQFFHQWIFLFIFTDLHVLMKFKYSPTSPPPGITLPIPLPPLLPSYSPTYPSLSPLFPPYSPLLFPPIHPYSPPCYPPYSPLILPSYSPLLSPLFPPYFPLLSPLFTPLIPPSSTHLPWFHIVQF